MSQLGFGPGFISVVTTSSTTPATSGGFQSGATGFTLGAGQLAANTTATNTGGGFGATPASAGFGTPANTGGFQQGATGFKLGASQLAAPNAATTASTSSGFGATPGFQSGAIGFKSGPSPLAAPAAATTGSTSSSGSASSAPTPQPTGFGMGTPSPSAGFTGGFSLGALASATNPQPTPASTAPSTTPTLMGFSNPASSSTGAKPAASGFSLPSGVGVQPAATTQASTTTTTTQPAPGGFTLPTGLGVGSSLSAGAVSKPTAAATGFQLSSSASAPSNTLSLKVGGATTTASSTTTTTAATTSTGAATATTTTASTGAAASTGTQAAMTYKELEEQINKWWIELEGQEKVFLDQATKVNAWDKILIDNGQKITDLNGEVEKVKLDQQRLNHELDFIVAQQKELEEMLQPLEESVSRLPSINYQQHTDTEREQTYKIAENIDAQLKRMTEDLKEVIDHLNENSGAQDSSDPMLQVSKILNAHMESLQWIDQNTVALQRKTEIIGSYAEQTRKEHERNFRLAYS